MLHEFAIDPECFSSFEQLRRVTDGTAAHLGRFISDFHDGKWREQVEKHMLQADPLKALEVKALLDRTERRNGIIAFRPDSTQHAWCQSQLRISHFRRVVGLVGIF
ncbi:MAG: hypothetical protein SGI77_01140 [Pirellulaceae bacterium]|nr:hypothetical protein [Pirellulaceae bacterium]